MHRVTRQSHGIIQDHHYRCLRRYESRGNNIFSMGLMRTPEKNVSGRGTNPFNALSFSPYCLMRSDKSWASPLVMRCSHAWSGAGFAAFPFASFVTFASPLATPFFRLPIFFLMGARDDAGRPPRMAEDVFPDRLITIFFFFICSFHPNPFVSSKKKGKGKKKDKKWIWSQHRCATIADQYPGFLPDRIESFRNSRGCRIMTLVSYIIRKAKGEGHHDSWNIG